MPELPEVETIVQELKRRVVGKTFNDVEIKVPKIVRFSKESFDKYVKGKKITGVMRRAKLIILNLSSNYSLLFHLKLSGRLLLLKPKEKEDKTKHSHIIFTFKDNYKLVFNDLRKFGFIKLIETNKLEDYFKKEKYGPEPLDKRFTYKTFKEIVDKRPNRKIKQFLLDQTLIAGIGNIYSDEICYYAKVHPLRTMSSLSEPELKKIYKGIKYILKSAVKHKGSSVDDYVDLSGKSGDYVKYHKVYRKEGKPCSGCKGKIKRIKLGGRSSCFCPACQK